MCVYVRVVMCVYVYMYVCIDRYIERKYVDMIYKLNQIALVVYTE